MTSAAITKARNTDHFDLTRLRDITDIPSLDERILA